MSGDMHVRRLRAGPELDAELVRFSSAMGTGEGLQIALDRSPSFFGALEVEGENADVVAAVVGDENEVRAVGMGVMTEKQVFLNGAPHPEWVGQLSSARIDPEYQGGLTLARAYHLLWNWHLERNAKVYLTTVLEDAEMARRTFESGKGPLPTYRDLGRFVTLSQPVGSRALQRDSSMDLRVTRACSDDVAEILEFWRTTGPQRQFFPAYRREHLISERGLLRGLAVEDLLLARERRGGEIVGTLGLWDQGAFRRWRVHRLPRALAVGALFINSVARLGGGLPLPRKGEALPQRIVTALCVADDDAGVLQALWGEAVRRIARDGGAWLTVGLHELDPLLPWVRQRRPRELFSRLYLVHWPDGREAADAIDAGRCPYVELGGL